MRPLEASFEVVSRQLATSRSVVIAVEAECDQKFALIDVEVQKRQNVGALLAEVQHCLDDHSTLLPSSCEIFRHGVSRALHKYLQPAFGAVHKRTEVFCSVSTSHVEWPGEM